MERFLDAYFYVAKQLVTHQEFDIRVWRAAVSDEERRELIAVQRVHWGDRRPAPRDLCNMAKEGHHDDTIMNFLSDAIGNTPGDRLEQWLQTPYRGLPRLEEAPGVHAEGPVTNSTAVGHIFTRNEQDGFVNEEELTAEVDPPQEPTPLHLNTVYGRNEAYKATGKKKSSSKPAKAEDAVSQHNQNAAFYIMFANGHAKFHADRTPSWSGTEQVLMTLRELSDGQFIAKPSLNEFHVLSVADDVIISYQINLAEHARHHKKDAGKSDSGAEALSHIPSGISGSFEPTYDDTARKAAILRQLVASAAGPALTSGGATTAAVPGSTFTLPPNRRDQHRVHYFGTIDQVRAIEHTALFVDCEFVLPEVGYAIDSDVNHRCGVTHHPRFVSQTALASRYLDENLIYTTAHSLNFPFELHCIADAITPTTPRLVVAVWSAEADKKQTLQGYGVVTLSAMPGQCTTEIQLWRPTLHGSETLQSIFVGGSASLVNVEDAAIPYRRRADNLRAICDTIDFNSKEASLAVNNRAGLNTESCGSIIVSWMCITQRRYAKADDAVPNRFAKTYNI